MDDLRKAFEERAFQHYLEQRAVRSLPGDVSDEAPTPEQLFWRQPDGTYGVLAFNTAWIAFQWGVGHAVPARQTPIQHGLALDSGEFIPADQLVPVDHIDAAPLVARQVPYKLPIPPGMAEPTDVTFVEGWNQCCETFFGGLPAQAPIVITIEHGTPEQIAQGGPDLHDFRTHRSSWRRALEHLAQQDGSGYWDHELRAYDRAMIEFDRLRIDTRSQASVAKQESSPVDHIDEAVRAGVGSGA